jgi:Flp pilus assembly protein TadG
MKFSRQQGITTVEFAIVGATMLVLLLGLIEIGRAMFVMNALTEATRRAARMAAVCPINDPAIAQVGMFNTPGGTSNTPVAGLTTANFSIQYLNAAGAVLADPVGSFSQILFVRARIVNFQHQMLIPFATYLITPPDFATTMRRESLGVPRDGTIQPC